MFHKELAIHNIHIVYNLQYCTIACGVKCLECTILSPAQLFWYSYGVLGCPIVLVFLILPISYVEYYSCVNALNAIRQDFDLTLYQLTHNPTARCQIDKV